MKSKKIILASILAVGLYFTGGFSVNAESYISDTAPDKIVTNKAGRKYSEEKKQLIDTQNDAVLANIDVAKAGQNVIDYHTKDLKKIFCIDRLKKYNGNGNVEYTKVGKTKDHNIVNIIVKSEAYYKQLNVSGISEEIQKLEQSWLTQMAIWRYQDPKIFNTLKITSKEIFEEGVQIPAEPLAQYYVYSNRALELLQKADELVKKESVVKGVPYMNFGFEYDGKYTIDKKSKTIKTNLITIHHNDIATYGLDISSAPKGTKVYQANGTEIVDLVKISADSLYLSIPMDNIDNFTYDFNIFPYVPNYEYYEGYEYSNGVDQPLILVTKVKDELKKTLNLKGSYVEDTASSVANIIYFVGFLILIAGVGVIYTNVKSSK